ncbi:MAG: hypothetical protein C9356_09290 [Oleiphilus sp.]|nr:MAG: hypothetical protein C9356_09290 [Oleiphilus sp.]
MVIQDLFENWGIKGLTLNVGFLKMNWEPQPEEQQAAWELYVELITRVTTQELLDSHGDEQTALSSVHSLFPITRELLKSNGRKAMTFSKIAIVVLNQKIRPFTAKWHGKSVDNAFNDKEECKALRNDLKDIQKILQGYAGLLATVANVEDLDAVTKGPLMQI